MNSVNLYCLLLAASGIFLVYWSKKRGFLRESNLGIEKFSSFGRKIISKLADGTIITIGYACIGTAVLVLLVEHASEYLVLGIILYVAFKIDEEWRSKR